MCGRFAVFSDIEEIANELHISSEQPHAMQRYNIIPSQNAQIIHNNETGISIDEMKWGLIPSWAKDPSIGSRMINARIETLSNKPSYRSSLKKRRCLIPINGYYEWELLPSKKKQPYFISLFSKKMMTLAGLWASWQNTNGENVKTFTIITTPAVFPVSSIHDRMPAALFDEYRLKWLDGTLDTNEMMEILSDEHKAEYSLTPISTDVNNPMNDYPELLLPLL